MVGQAAKMFAAGAAWKSAGLGVAGRTLVRGLASKDETVRNIAGILMVKAGRKSGPLLAAALKKASHEHAPMLLRILGELGDPQWDGMLERYAENNDPEIAAAARDAMKASQFARQDRQRAQP